MVLIHEDRNLGKDLVLSNVLITIPALVLLDDLHLLAYLGQLLIEVFL